jgi:hypothetical protein
MSKVPSWAPDAGMLARAVIGRGLLRGHAQLRQINEPFQFRGLMKIYLGESDARPTVE